MLFDNNRWKRICYGLWAPVYDHAIRVFDRPRNRAISLLDLQRGERVLILGAGTGADLEFLPDGLELTAIDITPSMIRRLKQRAGRLGVPVDASVMDGHALEFPDSHFDAVILHLIVAVIPDPAGCLREVARVLRGGGRAVVMDKFIGDASSPHFLLRLAAPFAVFFGTHLSRKLGPLVEQAGLQITYQEPAAVGSYFKIALLKKG